MSATPAGCLSDNRINHLISGILGAEELAHIESHIAVCSDCRGLVGLRAASIPPDRFVEIALEPRDDEAWDGGRYEIRREIARGGMGRILEAWDRRHQRAVAIKVLPRGRPGMQARFAREVLLTARLEHPSIVALHDAGVSPEGEPFFVMKLVRGRSLAAVAADARTLERRLALLPHLIAGAQY